MEPRISVVTLGVSDLRRSRTFYEDGLGWSASVRSNEQIVFFQLGSIVLGLYPRDLLAKDATIESDAPSNFSGVTLAHNVRVKEEVDTVLTAVDKAGGTIVKPAQDVFWGGYSGYFADPDNHLWEVVHNPFWSLAEDGSLILPDKPAGE